MHHLNPSSKTGITDAEFNQISRVEELAYDLRIDEVMTRDIEVVTIQQQMSDVLEILRQRQISGLPVIGQEGALVGIVSLEDLIQSLQKVDLSATVAAYMTPQVFTVNAHDPVIEALKQFTRFKVGRLPVVDTEGRLVGIITKGDITRGVLSALEKDYQAEEIRRYRASHLFEDIHSDRTSLILRYHIKAGDFLHGGNASSNIKRALLRLGATPQIARRCGIAIYEAEMNLIIHTTNGGQIRVEIEPHRIAMKAYDDGPGIEDVDLAMKAGFSTAPESVRELGFGAGMGLVNIQRCVDEMVLSSKVGLGTQLKMVVNLELRDSFREGSS